MTVINLIDKSKLRALERRCNSKEIAEHVMSFLTVTTLQHLPAFANDLFTHSFQDHLGYKRFRVALGECQQIPPIFILQSDEKEIETETKTECESDTTNDSECESDTTNDYDAIEARSVRVKVVLW